jgi:hypothetical protein
VLVWIVFSTILLVFDLTNVRRWLAWKSIFENSNIRDIILIIASLLVLVRVSLWYMNGLFNQDLALQIGGYLDILGPLLNLIAWVSFEMAVLIILTALEHIEQNEISFRKFLIHFFMILSILGIFVLII